MEDDFDLIDYKKRDILLSKDDFNNSEKLKISPHLICGSYESYAKYINTMFYLEYEDCYRALKKEINQLKSGNKSINFMNENELQNLNKNISDLYFYLNGEVRHIKIDKDGFIIILDFVSQQRINTKRMKNGSLIVLTDNNFSNYALTTVFSQKVKELEMPFYRIELSLLNINKEIILFLVKNRYNLQIFESKAYFESYIHVMKRLKEVDENYLPFKNELVYGKFETKINSIKLNINLDNSQLNAINKSLSNNISLIQGPPGTGKTYVGIILVRILLQLNPKSQILIVSYTNHALDSFLEEIIKYTDSVVRIGGRCKNEKLKEYMLDNSEKYYNNNYKNELNDYGENLEKEINETIDDNIMLNVEMVKEVFYDLYEKIKDDFKEKFNIEGYINYNQIYILWNILDLNDRDEVKNKLSSLLEYEFDDDDEIIDDFFEDNISLLQKLYNNNLNKYYNINVLNFNYEEELDYEEEEYYEDDKDDCWEEEGENQYNY